MGTAGFVRFPLIRAVLVAVAAAAALVPVPARLVDRLYSGGLYTRVQPALTTISNLTPIALFDVLAIAVVGVWAALAWRDIRRGPRGRAAGRVLIRTATWTAAFYVA